MASRLIDENGVIDFIDQNGAMCFLDESGNYTCDPGPGPSPVFGSDLNIGVPLYEDNVIRVRRVTRGY
jgi:hypothetical protein